ncbi:MAG: hypothetical protein WCT18_03530 [Patescibacteria group bacterium]
MKEPKQKWVIGKTKKKISVIFFVFVLFFFWQVNYIQAAWTWKPLVPSKCQGDALVGPGECDLSAVEELISNLAQIILGATGSIALLAFVYAGFKMVISQGNSTKIAEAKKMISLAVTGLILVIFAGAIVKIGLGVLAGA